MSHKYTEPTGLAVVKKMADLTMWLIEGVKSENRNPTELETKQWIADNFTQDELIFLASKQAISQVSTAARVMDTVFGAKG